MIRRFLILCGIVLLAGGCGSEGPLETATGGGDATETGNAFVSGKVVSSLGLPVADAEVKLIPVEYDPVADSATVVIAVDTTDSMGYYCIPVDIDTNALFNVLARSADLQTSVFIDSIEGGVDDSVVVSDDTLCKAGMMHLTLDSVCCGVGGYLYLPGTDISLHVDPAVAAGSAVIFTGLPCGGKLKLRFHSYAGADILLYERLHIAAGDTTHCPGLQCKRLPVTH